ncbi:topoisomerase IB [Saccharomonospora marina XMU15]|uniref:DNA topoisomerase n=1 Tax=Saccharomonospora marina XMU15 TaxID=882083 RepID=H5XBB1_9PSEU|nr:DNA topoisomerase IB [Saccharomonospora marina]EHR49346.1 topoisomerase IB [Saccharomonospora marina XMU15]
MRLHRSDLSRPGIRRRRSGKGFRYVQPDGSPLRDEDTAARIRGLAIPPAWRGVWICPRPDGHIQAIGVDGAGRRQYLYHSQWRRARDEEKHKRVAALGAILPRLRARLREQLDAPGLGRERVLAAALRMIDRGVFRVGHEQYAEDNGSRGAATLLRDHVRIRRDELTFRFPAKGGAVATATLPDEQLAAVLTALRRRRTADPRLLAYRTANGWRNVRAEDVNERFKELAGEDFTVKDLRTWNATVLAAVGLGGTEPPSSQRATKRAISAVLRDVADELGNTPAVARRSYVDPRVITAFTDGLTIRSAVRRVGQHGLNDDDTRAHLERAVLRLLRKAGQNATAGAGCCRPQRRR